MHGDDEERTPIGPPVPVPGDDEDALSQRCLQGREDMLPKETADCAGVALTEQYENEEDGGS